MQDDPPLPQIKFVKDAIIADTQTKLGAALQSLMWKPGKVCAHPIHFIRNRLLNGG